ncbi:putative sinapine esterase [Helianthus annuus]|nr:putative sinapine esterase [Helianthus annuus]
MVCSGDTWVTNDTTIFWHQGSGSVVASRQGMNYAVAGSTAIDSSFVEAIASGNCRDYIGRSLILMGEIGDGGSNSSYSGNFPIGCCPSYLTTIVSEKEGYDPLTGCLTELNEFSEYHNQMLQTKLNQIRELNPNVVVIYADYYNAHANLQFSG